VIIAIGCAAGRIMSTLGLPFAAINTDWRELENCAGEAPPSQPVRKA
jgi:hypothetical protein